MDTGPLKASPLYARALAWLLKNEGGYVNHPADPGGATNFGVTQRSWAEYTRSPELPTPAQMAAITVEQARAFYFDLYWRPLDPEPLPEATAIALFDIAVVCGVRQSVRLAQAALHLRADGVMGPLTHASLLAKTGPEFIAAFVPEVLDNFARIVVNDPVRLVFLRGWVARGCRLLRLSERTFTLA